MSVSSQDSQGELHAAWAALTVQWQETRLHWRDEIALEFEGRYWERVERDTAAFIGAAERLNETIDRALRDTDS